jgi:hypothetical protein
MCKETMVPSRTETEEGDWIFGWLCGCNEEIRKRDAESPVLCSDVLVGTPANDIICIQEAMGLMNSMLYSGETHTLKSQKVFHEAMAILRNAN